MTATTPTRRGIAIVCDVIGSLAVAIWVGGHGALGAFGARIAFSELARPDAARTMTRVFHEFDRMIWILLVLLAISSVVGLWARGAGLRSQIRCGLELGLCALGLVELLYVHPAIEAMFAAGRTLEPAFAGLHRLSERCAHGELGLLVAIVSVRAAAAFPE